MRDKIKWGVILQIAPTGVNRKRAQRYAPIHQGASSTE